jgi:hypothetical protein
MKEPFELPRGAKVRQPYESHPTRWWTVLIVAAILLAHFLDFFGWFN